MKLPPQHYIKTLITDLSGDYRDWQALNALLLRQREAILARDATTLDEVNPPIIRCYQQLTARRQQRRHVLAQLGVGADDAGVAKVIACLPSDHQSKVNALWQAVQKHASVCMAANVHNGALMKMQYDIVQNVLNAGEPQNWLYQQR